MSRLFLLLALVALSSAVAGSFLREPSQTYGASLTSVSSGGLQSCGETGAGAVKCWGLDSLGGIGDNKACTDLNAADPSIHLCAYPNDSSGLSSGVISLSVGYLHVCAVTSAGGVKCWGDDSYGQLGDGNFNGSRLTPTDVIGLTSGVVAVSAGFRHTCALTTGGGVKCWGLDISGELGDGRACSNDVCPTPVDVSGLTSPVAAISAGGFHTCALTTAGGIKCWGDNRFGQLGDGTSTGPEVCSSSFGDIPCSSTPVDVSGLTSGAGVVSAGYAHTCAVTAAGGAKCWGSNFSQQLGTPSPPDLCAYPPTNFVACSTTPVDVTGLTNGVAGISAGGSHTCGLLTTGGVACWGDPLFGQLGSADCTNSSGCPTPVGVTGLSSGADAVSAGFHHSCAHTAAGPTKCWGENTNGQLGDGMICGNYCAAPVDVRYDSDGDGCPDAKELRITTGSETSGGRRDPNNPWDYWNPTHDGQNRIDGVLVVAQHYGKNTGDPGYSTDYDRTYVGLNPWNLGPPNGMIRIDDVLLQLKQYHHDCS